MSRVSHQVPADLSGQRADRIVARLGGISRQTARDLFDQGVTVDGVAVAPNQRLTGGVIEFAQTEPDPGLRAEEVPFQVLYQDEDLLVVEKRAGTVVHPGAGRETGTLAAGLLERFPELAGIGGEQRSGLVHRLDKDTSGLLMVARTEESHRRSHGRPRRPQHPPSLSRSSFRRDVDANRHHRRPHRKRPESPHPETGQPRRPTCPHPLPGLVERERAVIARG